MALATGLKLSIKRIKAKIAAVVETGLATWHKMTANTWTGANRLPDSSTNSNTAALYTGRGLSFDGVNDVVTVGATGQTVRTVVFYAYPDSTTTAFMQLQSSGAVRVEIASGTLSATGFTSPTLYVNGAAGSTVAATTWQQLAVTSATGVSASNVLLGQSNTTYYGGDLSNVKFFSVQLSAAQIAELYANPEHVLPTGVSSGELVGWWPILGTITTVYDGSNVKKHGVNSGATFLNSQISPLSQSSLKGVSLPMFFDGINDSVVIPDDLTLRPGTSNFTYIVYLTTSDAGFSNIGIFNKGAYTGGQIELYWTTASNLRLRFYTGGTPTDYNILSGPTFLSGSTYQIVVVLSGTDLDFYINAVKYDVAGTWAGHNINGASNLTIGNFDGSNFWFKGIIHWFGYWNTNLSPSQISQLYNNTLSPDQIELSSLKLYVKNKGINSYDWIDISGNNNDASTINGSPVKTLLIEGITAEKDIFYEGLKHINNGELILNADGYALITDAASLDITTAITLEAWVKPFTVSTDQTIIGKNTAYALGLTSAGKPVFTKWTSAASTATATTTTALTVNTWYHLAVTYDGTNVKIYIDGAIDTTTAVSGAIDSTSTDVLMGALTTSTELFSGYIDSVKIYSSDLTAAQVAENYNAETAAHSNA